MGQEGRTGKIPQYTITNIDSHQIREENAVKVPANGNLATLQCVSFIRDICRQRRFSVARYLVQHRPPIHKLPSEPPVDAERIIATGSG